MGSSSDAAMAGSDGVALMTCGVAERVQLEMKMAPIPQGPRSNFPTF